ncbi:MAG TPA: glycosyltransferase [Thermoplasmata archaeon]
MTTSTIGPRRSGVSVVIPSAGRRHRSLRSCLESISLQGEQDEVLVVVPPGRCLPKDIPSFARSIEQDGSISAAVNAGIRSARNELVAVTHDDCIVSNGWLRELTEPMRTTEAIACVGQTVPRRKGRSYPATLVLPYAERRLVRVDRFTPFWELGLIGNNFAIRRDAIRRVGPFNERLGIGSRLCGGEDLDMFHRILAAGLTVCINPRALVYHEPLDTWVQEMRMMYTYRVGLAAYFFCHFREPDVGSYFVKRTFADQLRQVWRSAVRGRPERLSVEAIALLGLNIGLAKSWLLRPHAFRDDWPRAPRPEATGG